MFRSLTCASSIALASLIGWLAVAAESSSFPAAPPVEDIKQVIQQYALTSADDWPERDPMHWRLLGSNDGGSNWTTLDVRRAETFAKRLERRVFSIGQPGAFNIYRLQIDSIRSTNDSVQLAEFELLPVASSSSKAATPHTLVTAQGENPPYEMAVDAVDGDPNTKWLDFALPNLETRASWIQVQYSVDSSRILSNVREVALMRDWLGVRSPAVLVMPVQALEQATSEKALPYTVREYALTSANSRPENDPADWQLLGSNDDGQTWVNLDTRRDVSFRTRFQRKVFGVADPAPYRLHRLEVLKIRDPSRQENGFHLAELELIGQPGGESGTNPPGCVVETAKRMPPYRSGARLFDADPLTKWSGSIEGHPSQWLTWVQWWYFAGGNGATLNQNQWQRLKTEEETLTPRLRMPAMVVGWDSQKRVLWLVDATGHAQLLVAGTSPEFRPGQWVALDGKAHWVHSQLECPAEAVHVLAAAPGENTVDGLSPGPVEAVGVVKFAAQEGELMRLELERDAKLSEVWVCDCRPGEIPAIQERRVRVRGVSEAVFEFGRDERTERIWVANADGVELLEPDPADWSGVESVSLQGWASTHANRPDGAPLRVRGRVQSQEPGKSLVLAEGTNLLVVYSAHQSGVALGNYVEALGFASHRGDMPSLVWTWLRVIEATTNLATRASETNTEPLPLLTRVEQVRALGPSRDMQDRPISQPPHPVKFRGVITYRDEDNTFIQDATGGITVNKVYQLPKNIGAGDYVEIEGETRSTIAGNMVVPRDIAFLGRSSMPIPLHHSYEHLRTGQDEAQWVEVSGTVRAADTRGLTLMMIGDQLQVVVNGASLAFREGLVDAEIRVRGVCSGRFGGAYWVESLQLLVPSIRDVEVVKPVPSDPFAQPARDLRDLANLSVLNQQPHRIKVRGTVTYRDETMLFLQNQADGLKVQTRSPATAGVGDVVEAVGFLVSAHLSPLLEQAIVRAAGKSPLPLAVPTAVTGTDLAERASLRVRLEAVLLGQGVRGGNYVLDLVAANREFQALMPATSRTPPRWPRGCRLALSGVCNPLTMHATDEGPLVSSFELLLNSPEDVTVLARPSWWTLRRAVALVVVVVFALVAALVWITTLRRRVEHRTGELRREIQDHERAEIELKEKTGQLQSEIEEHMTTHARLEEHRVALEKEIEERKRIQAEVEKTHNQLMLASRQAGMAEIATGVLHNVGNVLNSINVSSELLRSHFHELHGERLGRIVSLLDQHKNDLTNFLTSDPKGRLVPAYLGDLIGHLNRKREQAISELQQLTHNIEHIKQVVAMQQSYARAGGVIEDLPPALLVEDALRMNAGAFQRAGVVVERCFQDAPLVRVDKHRVLQILLNLLRNAKHALDDSGRHDKQIWISIVPLPQGPVQVVVRDNGVGIAAEDLTRVFQHGFTTRSGGHGFGLHSGAIAAGELGGRLFAESDGPGHGAIFTLELPVAPSKPTPPN